LFHHHTAFVQVMRILDNIRPDRQTVMFSATFPRQMEALARRILKKPIEVTVGGKSVVSDQIDQNAVVLKDHEKFPKLLELLGMHQQEGQVLVFVNHQTLADRLLKDCLSAGYPCLSLHGGLDQQDRDSNIRDFKQGACEAHMCDFSLLRQLPRQLRQQSPATQPHS
jgi:ATP-dependent RNA helicase DDX46/PRP5